MEQLDKVILDLSDGDLSFELNRAETEFKKQVHLYISWYFECFCVSCFCDLLESPEYSNWSIYVHGR